ncbi:DNA mismatch repair protein Mlh3 [Caerostris darwini]|uniref:DNA mismatch repair protein Mlh3 n=1 Tax=Caerostris darwini TaxID=1538125 RepID=A0AAV4UL85_9ARAC|nr:DNA mismatch repair protein Mlh3 [Caerostris darwini]
MQKLLRGELGDMKIHLLDPNVVRKLRSDVAFISISHCVEELVWNSIDAEANCIAVRLNIPFYKIQVIDNGDGIPSDQMALVGQRYATSKCHSIEDLKCLQYGGFRGEALCSLKDVASNLMIETRASGCGETYCKIFNHGKSGKTTVSVNPRPSKGTTVSVFNFMYNRPVRKNAISEAIDMEETRRLLQSIALIHPNISFSLLNEASGEMCLQFKKCSSVYFAFIQLFGKEKGRNLKALDYHIEDNKISGYISIDCFSSKNYQFLYVNRRLVLKTRLHKLINNILNKVLSGKNKISCDIFSSTPQIQSPSKSQYCGFVLNITCSRSIYDMIFDRKRTMVEFSDWEKISELVQGAIIVFLKGQGLFSDSVIETKNLVAKSNENEIFNNGVLNLGIDNFRNGLFSNAVKRLNAVTEGKKSSDDALLSEIYYDRECLKSYSQEKSKIDLQDKHIDLNKNEDFNLDLKDSHERRNPSSIPNFQNKNFICLKNNDNHVSVFDNLKKINNKSQISKYNDEYSPSILLIPSTLESSSDIPLTSVFPTQNPVTLSVPVKSTLSLLEKEGKSSNALQKLKEKYLYVPKKNTNISNNGNDHIGTTIKENNKYVQESIFSSLENPDTQYENRDDFSQRTISFHERKNFKKTSKYTFCKDPNVSPLRRLSHNKNLKTKILALPIGKSSTEEKVKVNKICEIDIDSEPDKNSSNDLQHSVFLMSKEIDETDNPSHLKIFQTYHNEMDINKESSDINLIYSEHKSEVAKNPTSNVSQFENFNPFFRTFNDTTEQTENYDSLLENNKLCSENKMCSYNHKNKIMKINCTKNKNISLKKFQNCTELVTPKACKPFNKKKNQEIASNESVNQIFTNKDIYDPEESIEKHCITDICAVKNNIIKLHSQSASKNCDDDLTMKNVSSILNAIDNSHNQKSVLFRELNTFSKNNFDSKNQIMHRDFSLNTFQNMTNSSTVITENKQCSESLKCNQANQYSGLFSGSSSKNSFNAVISEFSDLDTSPDPDKISTIIPVSVFKEFNTRRLQYTASTENDTIGCSSSELDMDISVSNVCNFYVEGKCDSTEVLVEMPKIKSIFTSTCNFKNQENKTPDVYEIDKNFSNCLNTSGEQLSSLIFNTKIISPDQNNFHLDRNNQLGSCLKDNLDSPTDGQITDGNILKEKEALKSLNEDNNCSNNDLTFNNASVDCPTQKDDGVMSCSNKVPFNGFFCNLPNDKQNSLDKDCLELTEEKIEQSSKLSDKPLLCKTNGKRWICQTDKSTKRVAYIDLVTGNSTYFPPSPLQNGKNISANEESVTGNVKKQHFFLTHDFSPFLSNSSSPKDFSNASEEICDLQIDLDNYIEQTENNDWERKWRHPIKEAFSNNDSDDIGKMFTNWENPMFDIPSEVNSLEKTQIPLSLPHMYFLNSYRFTQNSLNNLKVIGQVDCKFIACIIQDFCENFKDKNLLVLFDQHAVHERVRLEELIADLYEMRESKKIVKTLPINPPITISLEPEEIRLLHAFHLPLEDIGFHVHFIDDEDTIQVSSLPSCFVNKENNQLRKKISEAAFLVEKIIKEWLDSLMQTRSFSSILPKTFSAVLNSQACRGAVKFGDPLNLSQCEDLLGALSKCKLPFQCAHGRPSIAPILDLNKIETLRKKRDLPKLWKLKGLFENHPYR